MKLTNTWKHAAVGLAFGFALGLLQKLINILPNTTFAMAWFGMAGFFIATIMWEYHQYVSFGSKRFYWQIRGIDTVLDLIAGNGAALLMLWFGGCL